MMDRAPHPTRGGRSLAALLNLALALSLCAALGALRALPVQAEPHDDVASVHPDPAAEVGDDVADLAPDSPNIAELMGQASLLNEETCASAECHPMLNEVPATSRHGHVQCVACHTQRRAHTEACVECHEKVLGGIDQASSDELREKMRLLREDDELSACDVATVELPPALDCLICHRELANRPVTFPQIVPDQHIPPEQERRECVECHRPHDPKPRMGHDMPLPYCRKGRDCCLSCHEKPAEITTDDRVARPVVNPSGVLKPPEELRDAEWMSSGFTDWVLQPPLIDPDHGHGTVECVACHSAPPAFDELARRVHNWQHEAVRCGRCHTGSNIVDQQVLLQEQRGQGHDVHDD